MPLKTSTSLHYAMPMGKNHLFHQPKCELDLLVAIFEVDWCVLNARIAKRL